MAAKKEDPILFIRYTRNVLVNCVAVEEGAVHKVDSEVSEEDAKQLVLLNRAVRASADDYKAASKAAK